MGRNPNVLLNTRKKKDRDQMVAGRQPFGRLVYVTYILGATGTDPYEALRHTNDAPQHTLRFLRASSGDPNHSLDT